MLPSTYALLESLDDLLLEKRMHPGVHRMLKTHDVVYHGQVGRFRVYSAVRTPTPSGTVLDLSKAPRFVDTLPNGSKKTTKMPANADGSSIHPVLYPPSKGSSNQNIHAGNVHRMGMDVLRGAEIANQELDRLGLPSHKLTTIVTDAPVYPITTRQRVGGPGGKEFKYQTTQKKSSWDREDAGGGSDVTAGHYHGTGRYHEVNAANALNRDQMGHPPRAAQHLAHEWVHHHQQNMSKPERASVEASFNRLLSQSHISGAGGDLARSAFARGYGKKNWKEWQATGIDAAVMNKQKLSRAQEKRPLYTAHPGAVKRLIGAMNPKQPLPEFPT